MRIVSLNLRYAHSADMHNQGHREPRIVDFVKSFRPDSFGTQECEVFWRERLDATVSELGYVRAQSIHENPMACKNNIWYDAQRNQLVDSGVIWLSETPEVASKGFGSRFFISAAYAVLKSMETGRCVAHVNTHLDVFKPETRMRELDVLKAKITELEDKGYAVLVTGDFNDEEDSDVYRAMTDELLDARKTAKTTTEMNTYNYCNSEGVIIPKEKYRRIDFCFHNGNKTGVSVERFDVVDRWTDGYMSDHNALIVDVAPC